MFDKGSSFSKADDPEQSASLLEESSQESSQLTSHGNYSSHHYQYIMAFEPHTMYWKVPLFIRSRPWYFWILLALAMLLPALILGTALTLVPRARAADGPIVDLGYAKYQGRINADIQKFLGIAYAAPPTDDNRFRGPKPPTNVTDLQQADKHKSHCFSTPSTGPQQGASEDCLYLDVYAPTDSSKTHPVFVWIQGGGFNGQSDNDDPSKIIEAGDHDIVVVTFTYRVGPWGFLASKEVEENGDLNAGNLDQRLVLQWVQENIGKFGGDPKRVTIGGGSAGAASVNLHMMAYGGRDDGLFQAVAGESNSFGQQLTVEESQYQYDALVQRVDCDKDKDTLACLRKKDIKIILENNKNIPNPNGKGGTPIFMYSNVIDGNFTQGPSYKQLGEGKFIKVPSIFGGTTNEGTVFTPNNINNYNDVDNFLQTQFSKLNASHLTEIDRYYPKMDPLTGKGDYWATAATAYGEMRYNCPGIYLSKVMASNGIKDTWHYHWDVASDADRESGRGVTHVAEAGSIWGKSKKPDSDNIPTIQGYWTSFIRTHDPNKLKFKDAPTWDSWDNDSQKRLHFVSDPTQDSMETVDQTQRDRCEAMRKIGIDVSQ